MNTANPTLKPGNTHPGDNVYMKAPQAYVPYAPGNQTPYGRQQHTLVRKDDTMLVISIVGLAVTLLLGMPVGVFTGPNALKRANRVEHFVRVGKRPPTDLSTVTGARVCAWISIAISIPLILIWSLVLVGVLFAVAA